MRVDFSSSDLCCSLFRATVYLRSIFILPKEVCKGNEYSARSSDLSSGMVQLGSLRLPRWLGTWSTPRERKEGLASREFMIGIRQLLPDICGTLPLTHIPFGLEE